MAVILNCLNFGLCYDSNALDILSVSKKYLDFANLKWRTKCTKCNQRRQKARILNFIPIK